MTMRMSSLLALSSTSRLRQRGQARACLMSSVAVAWPSLPSKLLRAEGVRVGELWIMWPSLCSSFTTTFASCRCHPHQHHHRYFATVLPLPSSSSRQQHFPTTATSVSTANNHHPPTTQTPISIEPIDFDTQSQISGSESNILEIQLRPNQILRAESGAMLYMTRGITMETSMGLVGASSSAFTTGLTRFMTGQNLMISDFRYIPTTSKTTSSTASSLMNDINTNDINTNDHQDCQDEYGTVGLGTDFPAKILKFELSSTTTSLICQKGAYLAGSHDVTMDMAYVKSFAGGFFGGEGFILQRLQAGKNLNHHRSDLGDDGGVADKTNVKGERMVNDDDSSSSSSTVFLKAYGTVVKRDLRPGEKLRVSSGCLVCMSSTIDYDVTMMTGFANVVFGGQGLFVTTLTGPGTVWLQSMPIDKMVSEIARHVPRGGGIGLGIPIMGGGGGGGDSTGVDGAATVGSTDVEEGVVGNGGDAGVSAMTSDAAAIDADRNATIASSAGVPPSSLESPSDPESPESLFGDAAFGGESGSTPMGVGSSSASSSTSSPDFNEGGSAYSTTDDASSQLPSEDATNDVPDFDESTISSEDDLFEGDGTTFSTYDGGGNAAEMPPTPDGGEGTSSILGQLWDLFQDFTDRD